MSNEPACFIVYRAYPISTQQSLAQSTIQMKLNHNHTCRIVHARRSVADSTGCLDDATNVSVQIQERTSRNAHPGTHTRNAPELWAPSTNTMTQERKKAPGDRPLFIESCSWHSSFARRLARFRADASAAFGVDRPVTSNPFHDRYRMGYLGLTAS
jgi:hypothetical protein